MLRGVTMQITVELPDEIARQLSAGQDLSRTALEALVAEGCRSHRLSDDQAAELLGLNHYELDGFLKQHGVYLDYSIADFERERALGERLWQKREAERAAGRDSRNR
jgi:predicted HTH domain antitoxin